jgi:hypothetical protein
MKLSSVSYKQWLAYLLMGLLVILYCVVAYQSFGYDDEYYNIRLIRENGLWDIIKLVESNDVHPPLSYVINYFLYQLFGDWSLVRVMAGLFFLYSLYRLINHPTYVAFSLYLILFIGFNPTILLWVTSIRWYAYAIPVCIFLLCIPDYSKKTYWFQFFLGMLILSYLGYIGIILLVPYFLMYWLADKNHFAKKVKRIIFPFALYVLLYSFQLYVLKFIHANNDVSENQQTFDIKTSITTYVTSVFGNQAVFPISIAGVFSIIGTSIVLLIAYLNVIKKQLKPINAIGFTVASILFLVTGIAGKMRNLVFIEPFKNLFITTMGKGKYFTIVIVGLLFIFVGNAIGVYNVVTHQNTTKNAWNLPVPQTMQFINTLEQPKVKEVYFTHSPSFSYHLISSGKNTISFYNGLYFDSAYIKNSIATIESDTAVQKNYTFLLTFKGRSISEMHYEKMQNAMKALKCDSVKTYYIKEDKEYFIKKRFYSDYPQHQVEVIKYYGVKSKNELVSWEKLN